jgi:hypothetical protein
MNEPRHPGWPDIERAVRIIGMIVTEAVKVIWALRGER